MPQEPEDPYDELLGLLCNVQNALTNMEPKNRIREMHIAVAAVLAGTLHGFVQSWQPTEPQEPTELPIGVYKL